MVTPKRVLLDFDLRVTDAEVSRGGSDIADDHVSEVKHTSGGTELRGQVTAVTWPRMAFKEIEYQTYMGRQRIYGPMDEQTFVFTTDKFTAQWLGLEGSYVDATFRGAIQVNGAYVTTPESMRIGGTVHIVETGEITRGATALPGITVTINIRKLQIPHDAGNDATNGPDAICYLDIDTNELWMGGVDREANHRTALGY